MYKKRDKAPARTPVHTAIDTDLVRRLDHLGVDLEKSRGDMIELVLAAGLAAMDKQPAAAS